MEREDPQPAPRRRLTIAILDDHQRAAGRYLPLAELQRVCDPVVTIYEDVAAGPDQLVARIGDAQVVIAMRERSELSREVIERLDVTELIVTSGASNAAIDLAAAQECGIAVCGTRSKDGAAAELAWGLLLALMRRIPQEHAAIHDGRWGIHVGDTLEGKRLGILGLGKLGRRVAGYGRAFGMEVLAHSRSLTREFALAVGCEDVSRDTLFRESDVVSVHLKLTPDTRGSIAARELGLMRRSAVLVNTARGALVDEGALVTALSRGTIAGAALDVYDREPLPVDSPLLALDNVVLTPHIGYVTTDKYRAYFEQAAEIIAAHLRGEVIRDLR